MRKSGAVALLGAFLLMTGAPSGATAAPGADRSPTKVAEATQAVSPAATVDEDTANCSKVRRRLWVEDEGWIVRRVTTCR